MANSTDIVGYSYRADLYCPNCIVSALPTGEGEAFDGWGVAAGVRMSTEENLDEIAATFGFDRSDESSFDGDEFPKVVFLDDLDLAEYEHCGRCHHALGV